jgi:DNA end-binding protein Ku
MARPLWKGAISFGLVSIPVSVFTATRSETLRFRQLDRRDNTPIREKRVNEETGEEVAWDDVVKGYEYDEGSFVVLDQDDFTSANVKATETIDIVQAVPQDAIPVEYYEKPLYVVPSKQGVKPYHILRETLRRTGRVGVATIVMRGRQHLAALIADERVITLELLRYAHEIKAVEELGADDLLEAPEVRDKEVELAEQLVAALDEPWSPEQFRDRYRDDLLELIEAKAKTGKAPVKGREPRERGGEVVDMMELLKRSVGEAKGRKGEKAGKDDKAGKAKTQRRKAS